MPVMDEFKEERESIKTARLSAKIRYFWDYYKFHTVAIISVITLIVVLVHDIVTYKEDAFFAAILNSTLLDEETKKSFEENFVSYAGIDLEEYNIQFDNTLNLAEDALTELNMSSAQRLLVYTSSGDIDVMLGGSDVFPSQANQGMFYDLREILSTEQIARYESRFYYIDQVYLDLLDEVESESPFDPSIVVPDSPDPTKPEEMKEPVPVGIFISDSEKLNATYQFNGDYTALGIMVTSPHLETSISFIEYLLDN